MDFKEMGATVNRSEFDAYLAKEAEKSGAKLILAARVTDIERKTGGFVTYFEKNGVTGSFASKALVIANGPNSSFVKKLIGNIYKNRSFALGIQKHYPLKEGYNFTHFEVFHDSLLGYGLGWISAYSKTAAIGVGIRLDEAGGIESKLDEFVMRHDISKKVDLSKPLKKEVAILPFHSFPKKLYAEGCIAVGDSAMLCNPFSGDGIYYALKSGQFASDVIAKAIKENDLSEDNLKKYQTHLESEFRSGMDISLRLQKAIYSSPKYAEVSLSSADKKFVGFMEILLWTKEIKSLSLSEKLNLIFGMVKAKLKTII
jgi:digeranylgeranylglycerophospholipid reductase